VTLLASVRVRLLELALPLAVLGDGPRPLTRLPAPALERVLELVPPPADRLRPLAGLRALLPLLVLVLPLVLLGDGLRPLTGLRALLPLLVLVLPLVLLGEWSPLQPLPLSAATRAAKRPHMVRAAQACL
jgi:hypothetical protein